MAYARAHSLNATSRHVCAFGLFLAFVLGPLAMDGCGPSPTGGGGDQGAGPGCDGFTCNPNGCNATSDCAKGLKCDPKSHTCLACASDTDCPSGQVCGPNHVCAAGCASGHSCAPDGGVCEADAGMCVQCLGDGDCTDPQNSRCDPASHSCFPCYIQNDNCGHATYCASSMNAYACAAGCKNDMDCPPSMGAADGGLGDGGAGGGGTSHCEKGSHACVECLVNDDCAAGKVCSNGHVCVDGCTNTHACAGGKSCCTGMCADATSDTANCGGCGNACKASFNCCSSNCSDPAGDANNCNGCGLVCKVAHATPACMMKMCAVGVCDAGFGDCDGAAANGCEVVLNTDVAHCGTCMTACMLANATPKCAGGVCQIALCSAGYADCNNKSADGCEINVLGSDLANCGMCGSACTVANGAPKCAMGLCQVASCNMGFGDCDGMAKNGCEVDLTSSLANCGACGMGCNLANAGPLCINSQCAIGTCNMGYSDCNKVAADGCEVNSQTDTANCGACGNPCSTNHGSASCAAGVCKISCAAGFADCNQSVADGCEVNLNGDPANCGGCALACSGANMSVNTCSGGVCTGTCTAGFGDCDGNLRLNGCEINTNTNISNCGGCGKACSGNNGTPSCAAGACSIVCAAGFGNCDGIVANGCEATLTNNNSNCGACGVVCGGGKSCVNSVCVSNTVPAGCLVTANPKIAICISNSKVSTYGAAAAHCAACTEKGLTNACVDVPTCTQGYTNAIVQNLYNTRTGLNCTAQVDQSGGCGWGEIMTPNYQAAGNCPTPQDCTSVNWQSCNAGVGGFDAYIYGVCNLP